VAKTTKPGWQVLQNDSIKYLAAGFLGVKQSRRVAVMTVGYHTVLSSSFFDTALMSSAFVSA